VCWSRGDARRDAAKVGKCCKEARGEHRCYAHSKLKASLYVCVCVCVSCVCQFVIFCLCCPCRTPRSAVSCGPSHRLRPEPCSHTLDAPLAHITHYRLAGLGATPRWLCNGCCDVKKSCVVNALLRVFFATEKIQCRKLTHTHTHTKSWLATTRTTLVTRASALQRIHSPQHPHQSTAMMCVPHSACLA
jgi:hypothetical protein